MSKDKEWMWWVFSVTLCAGIIWTLIALSDADRQNHDRETYSRGYCTASLGTWSHAHTICTIGDRVIDIPLDTENR